MKRLFSKSKRQNLIYFLLITFVFFLGIILTFTAFTLIESSHLAGILSAYGGCFMAVAGPVMGYIWSEVKRPHGNTKDNI